MTKLNQVIAIEKGVKSRVYADITEAHKLCQKPELFNGFARSYRSNADDGDKLPPENKLVQLNVADILKNAKKNLVELFDVTADKDWANTNARASVTVDGVVVLSAAPVTYLLFLEKQLNDIRKFIEELPELDPNSEWSLDAGSGLYKTDEIQTHRTKEVIKPILKIAPTKEHPGQADLVKDHVIEGYWHKTDLSGAIPKTKKTEMLERVERLIKAVKYAREEANGVDADRQDVGTKFLEYIGF